MNTDDLPYLVARVAALEIILSTLLARRTAQDNAALAVDVRRQLANTHYGDELLGDGVAFKASVGDYIAQIMDPR